MHNDQRSKYPRRGGNAVWGLILCFGLAGANATAWSQEASSQKAEGNSLFEDDLRYKDLRIELEKQRRKVDEAEKHCRDLKALLRKHTDEYRVKKTEWQTFKTGNIQAEGIYFQGANKKPLTGTGSFYEAAHRQYQEALEQYRQTRKSFKEAKELLKREKREFLEKVQRLKNYEEAVREGWPRNPF